jgi:hypothetical protein
MTAAYVRSDARSRSRSRAASWEGQAAPNQSDCTAPRGFRVRGPAGPRARAHYRALSFAGSVNNAPRTRARPLRRGLSQRRQRAPAWLAKSILRAPPPRQLVHLGCRSRYHMRYSYCARRPLLAPTGRRLSGRSLRLMYMFARMNRNCPRARLRSSSLLACGFFARSVRLLCAIRAARRRGGEECCAGHVLGYCLQNRPTRL